MNHHSKGFYLPNLKTAVTALFMVFALLISSLITATPVRANGGDFIAGARIGVSDCPRVWCVD